MSLMKFGFLNTTESIPGLLASDRRTLTQGEACFCRLAGPAVWCTPARETRRNTSARFMVRRHLAFDFCELLSMMLEPCEVGFQAPPSAGSGGQHEASGSERVPPRLASIFNYIFGDDHLAPHPCYLVLWALKLSQF